jgi:hypothetical protein
LLEGVDAEARVAICPKEKNKKRGAKSKKKEEQ